MKKFLLVLVFVVFSISVVTAKEKPQSKEKVPAKESFEYMQLMGMWVCGGYQDQAYIRFGSSEIDIRYVDMMGRDYQDGEFMRYMGSSKDGDKLVVRTTGRTFRVTPISKYKVNIDGFSECNLKY